MDKTLKRPLFKQKAMQAYKAKQGGKIPGFFAGGIMPAFNMLRTAAQPIMAFTGRQMARPAVRTALTGLEGYGVGLGSGIAAEGYREGDVGKMIEGVSYALPAAAFIPSTAKGSGIAALRETAEYLTPRATGLQKAIVRNPGKTAVGSIGTGITGAMLSGDAEAVEVPEGMSNQEYIADIQDRLIMSKPVYERTDLTEEEREGKDVKRKLEVKKPAMPIGIRDPKTEGERTIDRQLKRTNAINEVASKLGVTDASKATDEQIKQIAIESNVPETELRSLIGRQTKVGPTPPDQTPMPGGLTGNETEGELKYLIDKRKKDLTAAKELEKNDLATGFKNFRSEINKIVGGGNQNLNDLVTMKVAAKLLTGKTSQAGFAGLADVAGQALGVGADTLLAMQLAQRDSDMKLAQAYLQAEAKKKGVGGPKIAKAGDRTIRVQDETAPGGFRNVRVAYDENTGQFLERKFDPVRGQYFETAQFTGTDVKINQDKLNQALMNLEENRRGGKMVEFVINNADKGGAKAAFGLLSEDVLGTLDFFGGGNLGGDTSTIDDEIKNELAKNTDLIGGSGIGKRVNIFKSEGEKLTQEYNEALQDARENGAKEVEKQLKKAGIIAKGYRPTEEDLRIYTQLALIEQRMKYIVANANKSEDRLTQKDIDNAAKRTDIIKYIASPRTIRLNYESLQKEFDEKAATFLSQYKLNGGEEQFIIQNFMDIPGVKRQYDKTQANFAQKQAAQNKLTRDQILGSIPIGG